MTPPPAGAAVVPAPAIRPRRAPRHGRPARPLRPPARPRRISGPTRPPTRPSARPATQAGQRLPYHLLDRLIRGRAWIAVVGFALIGIVAAQLWVVKLNVGIGRAIEHAATLQRENSALAIEDSTLSSGERIEQLASAQGMTLAPPGALHFDTVHGPLDVHLAVAALARPVQPPVAPSTSTTATATATGTETSASATTGGETESAGATTAQSAPTETPPATAESAGAAAATTTAPSTTAASTPEPSATGGATEAPASTPTEAAGGTQAAPGG